MSLSSQGTAPARRRCPHQERAVNANSTIQNTKTTMDYATDYEVVCLRPIGEVKTQQVAAVPARRRLTEVMADGGV